MSESQPVQLCNHTMMIQVQGDMWQRLGQRFSTPRQASPLLDVDDQNDPGDGLIVWMSVRVFRNMGGGVTQNATGRGQPANRILDICGFFQFGMRSGSRPVAVVGGCRGKSVGCNRV